MENLTKLRWWLEGKSPLWHVGFILLLYAVSAALIVSLAWLGASPAESCENELLGRCLRASMLDILTGDANDDYPWLMLAVAIGKPILTVVSTSMLTISLLRENGRLILSDHACVYESSALAAERSTIKSPCLVFRMMNRGGKFLIDVKVAVSLRFVGLDNDSGGKTFRFFPLEVLGPEGKEGSYPMLDPRIPFRVYVRLDQEVQSAVYVGRLEYRPDAPGAMLDRALRLIDRETGNEHLGNAAESAIIVTVQGRDSISGKEVIAYVTYPLSDIAPGKFADIALAEFQKAPMPACINAFNQRQPRA